MIKICDGWIKKSEREKKTNKKVKEKKVDAISDLS